MNIIELEYELAYLLNKHPELQKLQLELVTNMSLFKEPGRRARFAFEAMLDKMEELSAAVEELKCISSNQ